MPKASIIRYLQRVSSIEEFDTFYQSIFAERWDTLKRALTSSVLSIPFQGFLSKPYYLNLASFLSAKVLGEVGDRKVLDLCAAPGGKTLVLASSLGPTGCIFANERSADRRHRLKRVIEEYLPTGTKSRIKVTGHDARRWGLYEKDSYDLILLDVPCSSERHLLEKPNYLKQWSPHRTRHLAQQAYTMLLSALLALKPNGRLLYCTCALSPLENDGVVERGLERKRGEVVLLPICISHPQVESEPTRFGIQILPDRSQGAGPLYLSLMTKKG